MDTRRATRTATRILVLALAVVAAGGSGGPVGADGVAVGPDIRVFGGDPQHADLVRWAAERFDWTGLGAPSVEVHFHQDTSACYGHLGSELGGRVDVCVVHVSEIARETLLHEMGHAWIDQHVAASVRERFMELRELRSWHEAGVDWDAQAYEHGAEIVAWGLGNRFLAPTIPDREAWRLRVAFAVLTGLPAPSAAR